MGETDYNPKLKSRDLFYQDRLKIWGDYFGVVEACDNYSEEKGWITRQRDITKLNSDAIKMHNQIRELDDEMCINFFTKGYRININKMCYRRV
jgi:hypothetical protein